MEILEKAKILSHAGGFDSCGPKMCEVKVDSGLGGIYHAKAEHKTCRLFKTLMDNSCSFDCAYCANSRGCKKTAAKYKPKELAAVFNQVQTKLNVSGLFLSSGIANDPNKTTEQMIEAVKIIRNKYNFFGYIHFKVLPGTNYDLIKQASELVTRMSINIEAPNKFAMQELSSNKDFKSDILRRQAWISKLNLASGQTTQIVVTKHSTDKDIVKMVDWEYNAFNLKRFYFSAFKPVKGTKMQNEIAETNARQNNLYRADFLLREYKFKTKEIFSVLDDDMLPKEDIKLALAKQNILTPIDPNCASYEELIRVPGIGPTTAKKLQETKIENLRELQSLCKNARIAAPFLKIAGKRQLTLTNFC